MRGHTPAMLLTTSTRDGIDSSPVMMARRRLVLDIIQSRCSAPFSRVTINSVMEKGSNDPKTADDTFCRQRLRRRRSKSRKLGILPVCASTHFPSTPCTCLPPNVTHQKSPQGTPNCQQPPQLTPALLPHV